MLAAGEDQARQNIREAHTWALRKQYEKRRFGGLNLCFTGDFWQFRPIQQTPIYDNPFKRRPLSSTESMLQMFWTKEQDSVQELFELTREHRCKDKWLSAFLLQARHGNMQHELYCFMHGLPTKHAGSWMPESNDVLCGQAQCRALPDIWERDLLARTDRTWLQRSALECQVCKEHRLKRCRVVHDPGDQIASDS